MVRLGGVLLAIGGTAAVIGIWRFVAVTKKLALTYKRLDE